MEYITFAIKAHEGQLYGDRPYEYHLAHVERILANFGYDSEEWKACAWLHDVIEDCNVSREVIEERYGAIVALRVWNVSGFGANRKEKQANIREKIATDPDSCILKLADRIANVETSISEKNKSKFQMYMNEFDLFIVTIHDKVPVAMRLKLMKLMAEGVNKGLDQ